MNIWEFLNQAGFWQWCGLIVLTSVVFGCISSVVVGALKASRPTPPPVPPQYVKCTVCKYCMEDSSCVTGQWVYNRTRGNKDEKETEA